MDGGAWWAAVHGVSEHWTRLSDFPFTSLSRTGEGNGNPLQCSCLEIPRDRGAWWASDYGVARGWTRLKRLSSSSRPDSGSRGGLPCLEPVSKNGRGLGLSVLLGQRDASEPFLG